MPMPYRAIAAYDFPGTFSSDHQLSIRAGDPLEVLDKSAAGWLWGTNVRTGQSGWFPATAARMILDGPAPTQPHHHPVRQHDTTHIREPQRRRPQQQQQQMGNTSTTDEQQPGFDGQAMGGQLSSWSPPPPPAIIGPTGSAPESSGVIYVPVPKGPKRQNPIQQTSWAMEKTARRTGRLFASASRKVGTTVLKRPGAAATDEEGPEKPPEITLPSIRFTGNSGAESRTKTNHRRTRA